MARKDEKIAKRARLACEKWREHFKHNIDLYHEMHNFVLNQQWDHDEQEMLKSFKKVPLVSNKLGTMSNILLGEQQQNTPQLQVVPMTNCDEEVAQLRELVIKDIMFSNRTSIVYQVAAGQAAIGGYSAFCVDTDYVHNRSFDQDIVYRHFKDATRTYFDMGAESINKTDGQHAGYITRITKAKFRELYGKDLEEKILRTFTPTQSEEEIALAVEPSQGEDPFTWADNEAITILDHYERKYQRDMLYKLSNGNVYNQEEMDDLIEKSREVNEKHQAEQEQQQMQQTLMRITQQQNPMMEPGQEEQQMPQMGIEQQEPMPQEEPEIEAENLGNAENFGEEDVMTLWDNEEPVRIEDKRPFKRHKIMHYKIAGDYILDESEFPSEQLPVVFVDQNSYYNKDGKQICRSFFGDAKDTQRYINYLRTQSAFILKISRYDQFIGSKKNVQGLDTQRNWADPGSVQGMLAFDESPTGIVPTQIRPPELSQSLFSQYELAMEDLYTSTGLYPSRMGQNGNEVSGVAIDARTRQGSYSTYVFFNSINRAIAAGGEIVNEMIPKIYDSQRVIALMTPDEGLKNVTLNKQADEYGELIENDIRKGTFEVRLKPGPSYEGQKEMALESLKQLLAADPQTFKLIADLYADNLPLANSIEIKNRLRTIVPPAIIEAGKTGQMPPQGQPTPEQQQMQVQQQQMQMEAQFRQQQIEIKKQELQLKAQQMQIDLEIEKQKLQAEEIMVMGEIEESKMRYMAETQRTENDASIAHANNLVKILTHKI